MPGVTTDAFDTHKWERGFTCTQPWEILLIFDRYSQLHSQVLWFVSSSRIKR